MVEIIWTNPALNDLNEIAEYISISTIISANKLVESVFKKVERLEHFPKSGKKVLELSHLSYREIIVVPCRVFYKIENNKVYILHVMRQERDLRKFLILN